MKLEPHPEALPSVDISVSAEASLSKKGWINASYAVDGNIDGVVLPPPVKPARRDELWKTTCFELFLKKTRKSGYCEFNFSPSGEWATYQFTEYREDMSALTLEGDPQITLDVGESHVALEAILRLPDSLENDAFDIGLSAVIEEQNGTKSYWALTHPATKPDFHHLDCFSARLRAADGA